MGVEQGRVRQQCALDVRIHPLTCAVRAALRPWSTQVRRPAILRLRLPALLAFPGLLWAPLAPANPQDGQVVAGSAAVVQSGTSRVDVIQGSDKAIIDWRGFSIGPGERTHFRQPSPQAVTLNRVKGGDASRIEGQLTANGQVFLVNGNGVLFGKDARVDVGGLVATTADIRNDDFMGGRYVFDQPSHNPRASIVNQGQIRAADGGAVVLAAPGVRNEGLIQARLGKVALAGTNTVTVDFDGDGLIQFNAGSEVAAQPADTEGTPMAALVANAGSIIADGGQVILTARAADAVVENVINMDGVVQARTAELREGIIVLSGGDHGAVQVSGSLDVSGPGQEQRGGTAEVLGEHVALLDGASVDVSGHAGGGHALIGGNLSGKGPEPNAATTSVAHDAEVRADALGTGDGGTVAVWAEQSTEAHGRLSARGGAVSGNGGLIETSARHSLKVTSTPDASAPNGTGGTWLIDPMDITIVPGSSADLAGNIVGAALISATLSAGTSVTLDTSTGEGGNALGDITQAVNADILDSGSDETTLTLRAGNSIFLNAAIQAVGEGARLNVVLNADRDQDGAGAIRINPGSAIFTNGGSIVLGGGTDPLSTPAVGTAADIDGIYIEGANLDAGAGNISLRGTGFTTSDTESTITGASGIDLRNGAMIRAIDGNVTLSGTGGGNGLGVENIGINMEADALVDATGNGSVSLTGTEGNGVFGTYGIYGSGRVASPMATLVSTDGIIVLFGDNDFGKVFITAGDAQIFDSNDINLDTSTLSGSLYVNAGTSLGIVGPISADVGMDFHAVSDITQTGTLSTTGSLRMSSSGGHISLDSSVSAGNFISLDAASGVSQTGALRTTDLELHGTGPFELTDPQNDVETLYADISGILHYTDANSLRIIDGGEGGGVGLSTNSDAAVHTINGNLVVDAPVLVAGEETLDLQAGGATSDLELNANVTATSVVLRADHEITQAAGTTITATNLGLEAASRPALDLGDNDIEVLAASTTGPGQSFAFTDETNLIIGSVGPLSGVQTNGGDVTLDVAGQVTQSAPIVAAGLSLQGGGTYTLTHPANDVQTLSADTGGKVQYSDASALRLTPLDAGNAVRTEDADVDVSTTNGDLTVDGPVSVGNASLTLHAGGATSRLSLNADVNGSFVVLGSDGRIAAPVPLGIAGSIGDLTATAPEIRVSDITTTGAQTYHGTVTLGSTYQTRGAAYSISGNTSLAADTTIRTAGGPVTFQGQLDGGQALLIDAGATGDVLFAGDVGTRDRLGGIAVQAARNVHFDGELLAGATRVIHDGAFTTAPDAIDVPSLYVNPAAASARLFGKVAGVSGFAAALHVDGPVGNPDFTINDCVMGVSCSRGFPVAAQPNTEAEKALLASEESTAVREIPGLWLEQTGPRAPTDPLTTQYSNFGNEELWTDHGSAGE